MSDTLNGHIIPRRVTGGKSRDRESHGREESKCTLEKQHHDGCIGDTSKQEGMTADLCLLMRVILLVITSKSSRPTGFYMYDPAPPMFP